MSSIIKPPTFKSGNIGNDVNSIITSLSTCSVSDFRPVSPLYSPSISSTLETDDDIDMFTSSSTTLSGAVSIGFKAIEQPLRIIPELDYIHSILKISKVQASLIRLYTDTMKEGVSETSFKRDLGAVLKLYIGSELICLNPSNYIDGCTCDFVIGLERFVCSHSIGGVGLPIKVKWLLSPKNIVAVSQRIHLLMIYFDQVFKKVTIICISGEHHRATVMSLKDRSFSTRSNGEIEYTSDAMRELLRRPYFIIDIDDVEFSGIDPIERRIKQLCDLGLSP